MVQKHHRRAQDAPTRQPRRPHYIPEWAERSGFKDQAALVNASGADKSVVSRWYKGTSPGIEWQERLCRLFKLDDPALLFQHPDEAWLSSFVRERDADEIQRARTMLEAAFPPKVGGP